jgi:hypothetical protein
MKNRFLLLLFINITFYVNVKTQTLVFPDSVFKSKLLELGFDINHDNEIENSEAIAIVNLNVSQYLHADKIKNLKGIENFINLESLECDHNEIDTLDISKNLKLLSVNCTNNQNIYLKINRDNIITRLTISSNNLNSLLLPKMDSLTNLDASDNSLNSLPLDSMPKLSYLFLDRNKFQNPLFSLSKNKNLKYVSIEYTNLEKLDISESNISTLYCRYNTINELKITNTPILETLNCSANKLSNINIASSPNLNDFSIVQNNLDSLDVSKNANLGSVICDYNKLVFLKLSSSSIGVLNCDHNLLESLNLDSTKIRVIYCGYNKIKLLNATGDPELVRLECPNNEMTSLILNNNKLQYLECSNNNYLEIDLTNIRNLISAVIYDVPSLKRICVYNPSSTGLNLDRSDIIIEKCSNSLIEINNQNNWSVYPNPFEENINIKTDNNELAKIVIVNTIGHKVYEKKYVESNIKLDLSFLSKGFYILNISSKDKIQIFNLIKK